MTQKCKVFWICPVLFLIFLLNLHADWPNHRGDPSLCGIASGNLGDELVLEWTFEVGKFLKSSPVVEGGKIFLGGPTGDFHAIDAWTGKTLWQAEAGIGVDAPAMLQSDRVFVGSKDGKRFVLSRQVVSDFGRRKLRETKDLTLLFIPSVKSSFWEVMTLSALWMGTGHPVWKFETMNYVNGTLPFGTISSWCLVDAMHNSMVSLSDGKLIRWIWEHRLHLL